MIEQWLLTIGSLIFGLLGLLHLFFTFYTNRFYAVDDAVTQAMQQTSPRISRDTTMWDAWVGFNASHSLGAMIFAAVYIPLSYGYIEVIRASLWFSVLPVVVGCLYLILAWRYWFVVPLAGILAATLCFAGALLQIVIA